MMMAGHTFSAACVPVCFILIPLNLDAYTSPKMWAHQPASHREMNMGKIAHHFFFGFATF